MNNKYLAWIWGILVFVTLGSGIYLLIPDKNNTHKIYSVIPGSQALITKKIDTNGTPTPKAKTEKEPIVNRSLAPTNPSSTTTKNDDINKVNTINISVEINGQKYPLSLLKKSTAYDAMIKLVNDKKINAIFKEFTGLGYFTDEINGVKTDKNSGTYWIYYINGQSAQVGISQYILKNNDLITWKYTHSI